MHQTRTGQKMNYFLLFFIALCAFPILGFAEINGKAQSLKASTQKYMAVVITVAADYSSGAHSVIPTDSPRTAQNNLLPTISDLGIAAFGNHFYRIERFQADNVTKFHINAPSTPVWQFSTKDENESVSGNPYSLIFLNESKAYLLRYNSTTAWVVNPSATSSGGFKLGELDLSAYADQDGMPEMSQGVIVDGKLFILLQRLDKNNSWVPNDAYIAVFDTATDTEIDTKIQNADGVLGIPMPVKNLGRIQYCEENKTIYVQGAGQYSSSWSGTPASYSGGIATVNPSTYETRILVDDGDDTSHPYGNFSGLAIASVDRGYFVGYAGWGDNTLYHFNPTTGEVYGIANTYLQNKNIAGMEAGAYVDENGFLWMCNATDSEVVIINTHDNTLVETISTDLNPVAIVFVAIPADTTSTGASNEGDDDDSTCFIHSIKR